VCVRFSAIAPNIASVPWYESNAPSSTAGPVRQRHEGRPWDDSYPQMTAVEAPTGSGRRRSEVASPRRTSVLQELLTELAFVLLPRGMTPRRFDELARFAFVRAATEMSRLRNGRVNYSRVAAQTGLSRADVKRLLKSDVFKSRRLAHSPIERVVNGWRTDRRFANRPGRPTKLRIAGPNASFASLVRKYGGDVPHKAVLDELRRIDAVTDDGTSVWLKTPILRKRHDFAFLSPVLPVLVDGIRIASKRRDSRSSSSIQRLKLPVESEVDLAIVRERCLSSARSMLDGLGESLGTSVTLPRTRRNPEYSFTVTILLAENRASKSLVARKSAR
jgi:hypothetical protein